MSDDLGALVEALLAAKERVSAKQKEVEVLESEAAGIEARLLDALRSAGSEGIRTKTHSAIIKTTLRAKIVDFDRFWRFVKRKDAPQLFERRIGVKAYKEMKGLLGGKEIPGLEDFPHERVGLYKLG